MKLKFFLILTILTAALSPLSCAVASSKTHVQISCDELQDNHHIRNDFHVTIGETIMVELCSNPTTGFKWKYETIGKIVLEKKDYEFVEPEDEGIVGAGGKEVWTFEVIEKGTTEIRMEYTRPWEGGEQGEWTYTMTVTVD
ncbi:protease inhibitor I42 family protein [Chloroflexota bacterium]